MNVNDYDPDAFNPGDSEAMPQWYQEHLRRVEEHCAKLPTITYRCCQDEFAERPSIEAVKDLMQQSELAALDQSCASLTTISESSRGEGQSLQPRLQSPHIDL
jgi:hypothetical protein